MNLSGISKAVIIVAGGSGKRMGAAIPKQFLLLANKPVLQHTLLAFFQFDSKINIILVLPEDHISHWKALCEKYQFELPHQIAIGGNERFDSVKNGLQLLNGEQLVGVHDGVRPLISSDTIGRCFEEAHQNGAAVPCVPVSDTLRKVNGTQSHWVNRAEYVRVQTPQCFRTEILMEAYNQPFSKDFTDDASVVERTGHPVSLVQGNEENIKITGPADLVIAEALLAAL
jgi:2-C-methyl-D-erythritol 4-phosphate cytidylyltransferase